MNDDGETVTEFSYLGDRINSGGGCEAAYNIQNQIMCEIQRMPRFTLQKEISLKIKGIVYKSCVRSAILYGSETWSLGLNEIGILQRTEKAMVRNMCGVKLIDKKSTRDILQMLDLNETIDQLAKLIVSVGMDMY